MWQLIPSLAWDELNDLNLWCELCHFYAHARAGFSFYSSFRCLVVCSQTRSICKFSTWVPMLQLPTLPVAHIQVASITLPDVMQRATYCMRSFMFLIAVITLTFKIEAMFSFMCFNIHQMFIFKNSFACFRIVGTERCSIVPIFLPENSMCFFFYIHAAFIYTRYKYQS